MEEEEFYELFVQSEKSMNSTRNLKFVEQILSRKLEKKRFDLDEKLFEKIRKKREVECLKALKKNKPVDGIFHAEAIKKARDALNIKIIEDKIIETPYDDIFDHLKDNKVNNLSNTPIKIDTPNSNTDEDDIIHRIVNTKVQDFCKNLKDNSFCNDRECQYSHKSEKIICRNSLLQEFTTCKSNCKFVHPNPELLTRILETLESKNIKGKNQIKYTKVYYKAFFHKKLKKELCREYRLFGCCKDMECSFQHLAIPCDPNNPNDPKPKKFKFVDETDKVVIDHIHTIYKNNSKGIATNSYPIQKIERIENEVLEHAFHKRSQELKIKYGCIPETIYGFHGTAENVIPLIADTGFSKSHQIHNAYGVGTYFARDPCVSITGYCKGGKKLFFCQLLVDKDLKEVIYEKQNCYFIVPEVSGILPTHVITFK